MTLILNPFLRASGNLVPMLFVSLVLFVPITAQSAASLTITAPANGAAASAGNSLTITVSVTGTYPNGIAVIGQDPLGSADIQSSIIGGSVNISLPIPANAPPGMYTLTAIGGNSGGGLISSAPINIVVEAGAAASALSLDPSFLTFSAIGQSLPFIAIGTFAGGKHTDVTGSSLLTATSVDPSIAAGNGRVITSVGMGQTNINVQYGLVGAAIGVTVFGVSIVQASFPHPTVVRTSQYLTVTMPLENVGNVTAQTINEVSATLNGVGPAISVSPIGNLTSISGNFANMVVNFPVSAGAPGELVTLF